MPTDAEIREALKAVIDPELRRDIVELEMVRSIAVKDGGIVDVTVSLTTPGCPIKGHFQTAVAKAVTGLEGVTHCNVGFDVLSDQEKGVLQKKLGRPGGLPEGSLAQVENVICVGSGKGGVGKSSLTVNLAAALAADGKRVGVLDADVWGYSIPRMLGLGSDRPKVNGERKILPLDAHGLKVMSIGFFVKEDEAVVWRGPMLHKALTQFLEDVAWGELDYLLIDLPPGHRRRLDDARPAAPAGQVRDRHHPAGGGAEGRAPLSRDGRQGQARDRGRDREHVRLHHAVGRALRDLRRGRRRPPGRRARGPAARHACRSRWRCASRPTRGPRWSSPTRTTPPPRPSARPRAASWRCRRSSCP